MHLRTGQQDVIWRFVVAVLILCMGHAAVLLAVPVDADSPVSSKIAAAEQAMEQGWRALRRGAFAEAVSLLFEAAGLYERANQPGRQSAALTPLARAYQSLGSYQKAVQSLEKALALAEQAGDRRRVAMVLKDLGHVHTITGPAETAQRYLDESLRLAREVQDDGLAAAILYNRGNLLTSQTQHHDALAAYTESARLAQGVGHHALVARALTKAALAELQREQYDRAKARLDMAAEQLQSLAPAHDKAYSLIDLGLAYDALRPHLAAEHDHLLLLAAGAFRDAARLADDLGDAHAASYAWGYLGRLYEADHQYQEALQLTRQAIFAAQQVQAPESLYLWQWQSGRLLKAQGAIDAAIATYQRAVDTLQSIRQELSLDYGKTSSFREAIGPVYFELVDLLLQRAATLQERIAYQPYLMQARATVELFKAAELQDYFQDVCVAAAQPRIMPLDVVSQTAVVVYPILLPDRLELLVSLPGGLERYTVSVSASTLTQEVRELRRKLEIRITNEYLSHAQNLYNWLIRPLEPALALLTLDTLVFVPDGPLWSIPWAALHDGQQFLVSKYALAVTPGLDLTDPRPLRRDKTKVLGIGLTEAVQGFPALPNVAKELQAIQRLYEGKVLLDRDFRVANIERTLREENFTILHIASHAQFAGDLEKTFILTYDDKLTIDRLEQIVGLFRFRDEPLELLTLSAGETAVGDDRAASGLAGIAIKAGARSALATLWSIPDEAASILVVEFYQQLRDPAISRAVALQRAQLQLLSGVFRYRHPWWWASFLLLNNWL